MGACVLIGAMTAGVVGAQKPEPSLVFLNGSKVLRAKADGSDVKVIVDGSGQPQGPNRGLYDGVAYEPKAGHIYWTDMGRANADDGTVTRARPDGSGVTQVVRPAGTFTPKQIKIDEVRGKLYWSDREGMRIMRSNLDGSNIETLVQTGSGDSDRKDQARWCVGIALDVAKGHVYWTQKGGDDAGQGLIRRAAMEIPKGQTPGSRTDIETLFSHLPEPIDLDLDLGKRQIYWTDRGDNTVNRAPMDPRQGYDPAHRSDRQILVRGLNEAIGLALDLPRNRMFYTSLGGELGVSKLDGSGAKMLLSDRRPLTGITLVP
jgi:DNA-binding beta-propeller fold protein YncE